MFKSVLYNMRVASDRPTLVYVSVWFDVVVFGRIT